MRCSIWRHAQAKYQKRYPEAIRSLCEDEEHLLTFYAFPLVMHRSIRSTAASESFFSNVRQRTDQVDAFTTETSCLTIGCRHDARYPCTENSGCVRDKCASVVEKQATS